MESSRTSYASRASSRTHFEVLGLEGQVLGFSLEASSSRKLPCCRRLENSTFFWSVEKIFWLSLFLEIAWKKIWRSNFWRTLASVSLASSISVLGFERVCPWKGCPWPWPQIFFCVLGHGLEPCVLDSTSDVIVSLLICRVALAKKLSSQ